MTYGARGFFKYWRKARQNKPWQVTGGDLEKAYYSYNLGAWHIIVINSECADSAFFRDGAPSCDQGSEQERWLRDDLKRFPAPCTLAYCHHPLFNNGATHGGSPKMKPIWQALYDFNADVVLTGHEHDYERFAPHRTRKTSLIPGGASANLSSAPAGKRRKDTSRAITTANVRKRLCPASSS